MRRRCRDQVHGQDHGADSVRSMAVVTANPDLPANAPNHSRTSLRGNPICLRFQCSPRANMAHLMITMVRLSAPSS